LKEGALISTTGCSLSVGREALASKSRIKEIKDFRRLSFLRISYALSFPFINPVLILKEF